MILGIGGVMMDPGWFDGGGLERLAAAGLATAQMTRVPTAFILNEVATFSQIMRGIRAGFNAVMLDSTALPYAEHARLTRQVVEAAHPIGVAVEAELGALPDGSGELGGEVGHMTDPDEAARFVAETGVDALAVSVGNIHILLDGQSPFDRPRLAALRQAVSVPLVLHGGSGFPDAAIPDALALGVAKVNFGSALKRAFLAGLVEGVGALPERVSYHQAVGSRKPGDVMQQAKDHLRARDHPANSPLASPVM